MSPLMHLLDFNALNMMLNEAIDLGPIKGVPIPKTGEEITHGFFTDDTNAFLEAQT